MQSFEFDAIVDRRGTSSSKWQKYGERDVIPMWVADMDFRTAPAVVESLRARVEHGIFGYTEPPAALAPAVVTALERDFGWHIESDWIVWLPSLVVGLNVVCRAFAAEGDDVLTAVPIYPPFLSAPLYGGRNAVRVELACVPERGFPLTPSPSPAGGEGGGIPLPQGERGDGVSHAGRSTPETARWEWDFAALERAVTPRTRLLMLCHPHNPTGRVWNPEELRKLLEFAERHDFVICSDEIHSGLVLDRDKRHVPIASLSEHAAARTVTLMSASKTFNLPALGCAFAIAPHPELRARLRKTMAGIVHHVGGLGYVATLAALQHGKPWHLALLEYLRGNRDTVERAIAGMRGLRTWHVEATYLAWIDARELGVPEPVKFFESQGVGLYDGALFGTPGFLRLNFACRRKVLEEGLRRMAAAVRG
jgi:cystathionine beta-lyase